jgi:hypothetical protein
MTDFKEEAYVLEKIEISEDDDDDFEYKEIKAGVDDEFDVSGQIPEDISDQDDDLNDF